jgi:arsenate reductase-like glutaredoxin family protein
LKTNFRKELDNANVKETLDIKNKNATKEEFEDFMIKSGAKGSFMVYRSKDKKDELGIDKLI